MGFNNAEPISKEEAESHLKEDCPGLLLQDERVEMGFKATRDKYYFTTHRVLIEDKHGITGKRTEYKSCPYHSIKAFSVETSGSFDSDVELKVYGGSLDLSIDKQKTTEKIQVEAERSSEPPVEIEVEANQVVLEPDFVIAGHMFIKQASSSNRLFIGDSSYKAGDMLDTNWMLIAINADNFVVQAQTRVEIIAYR